MLKSGKQYDVVVVGGSMIGAAAALGLAQAGFSVALLEQYLPTAFEVNSQPALRVSALSCTSVDLLTRLGVWADIQAMRVTPYRQLRVWEWDQWQVNFTADSLGLPELGFMVENSVVQWAIWQKLQAAGVVLYAPHSLSLMTKNRSGWSLQLDSGEVLQSQLVIGADGAGSKVRRFAGIGLTGWQYRQSCLLIGVKTQQPQQDTTWQRFYPSGPRAFLPLQDSYAELAWYDQPQRIRQLASMSMAALTERVMQAFPGCLGEVDVWQAGAFPLVRQHAQRYVDEGVVLLGDAAHTIHPLAGQGVNLGYRDLVALLAVLVSARDNAECWHQRSVLQRYQCRRRVDNLLMQGSMDLFYKIFSNSLPLPGLIRNVAMLTAEHAGQLKIKALKYALGYGLDILPAA